MYEEEHEAPQRRGGGGFGRAVKNLFLFLVVAALAFAVLYMVAERNARRYYLVPEEGSLVVKRGIFFPVGEKPYLPEQDRLAEAYAPVPIPAGEAALGKQDFEEREDLNYALFDILMSWARPRIESGNDARLEGGISYLTRAELLPVYDPGRRQALEELRAEVAWYEAQRLLDASVASLAEAAGKLAHARDANGPKAEESGMLLQHIRREMANLRSLQRTVASLSAEEAPGSASRGGQPAPAPRAAPEQEEPTEEAAPPRPSPEDRAPAQAAPPSRPAPRTTPQAADAGAPQAPEADGGPASAPEDGED